MGPSVPDVFIIADADKEVRRGLYTGEDFEGEEALFSKQFIEPAMKQERQDIEKKQIQDARAEVVKKFEEELMASRKRDAEIAAINEKRALIAAGEIEDTGTPIDDLDEILPPDDLEEEVIREWEVIEPPSSKWFKVSTQLYLSTDFL